MNAEAVEIITPEALPSPLSADSPDRAAVDIQVTTAHRYPRNLTRCLNNSIAVATMTPETARACGYALPRGGRPLMGPSVHLARILARQYGNLRVEAKVVEITARQVVSRATAWDLETNTAVAFEVRRSIIDSKGNRYKDDMITVTGNAANSIAYRNVIFNIVPGDIIETVYKATQQAITGDLSDEVTLIKRRDGAIRHFFDAYAITEEEVVRLCGKQTVNQIGASEIAMLLGVAQSLKDGDTTVDEVMYPIRHDRKAKAGKLDEIARNAAKRKTGRTNPDDQPAPESETTNE